MVILGLLMLTERKILKGKIFKTKVKLPVTWQKYHYEIGFIQQDMRILGHAIPAKGKINFPVICKKFATLHYSGH
jgi:hypothetical protein